MVLLVLPLFKSVGMLAKNYWLCELHQTLLPEPLFWKPKLLLLTELVEQLLVSPCSRRSHQWDRPLLKSDGQLLLMNESVTDENRIES
jgi:hypothetical protein